MSKEGVKAVVAKMITDDEFKLALFQDPEKTIRVGGFDITEEELEAFKEIQEEDLANLSPEELEERLSQKQTNLVITGSISVSDEAQQM